MFGLNVDQARIGLLTPGGVPIFQPDLKEIIERHADAHRLTFSTGIAASVAHASVQFIAAGTPPDQDGSADLHDMPAARPECVGAAPPPRIPTFSAASKPEFLNEGAAVEDFTRPDRIVLGEASDAAGQQAPAKGLLHNNLSNLSKETY